MIIDTLNHPLWIFFLISGLCVVLVGIDKAGFGGGVGTIATPLMALMVSPMVAAGILLPLLCACDVVSIWHYRRIYERRSLWALVAGSMGGILLGTGFLWFFKEHATVADRALRMTIGLISVAFVLWQIVRGWLLAHLPPRPARIAHGVGWGALAGAVSTVAHAGGPPVAIYLIPQRLNRRLFVGTTVWFFAVVNYVKLIPYVALGMIHMNHLRVSLFLLPLVPIGVWLGVWLNRRLDQRLFERIIHFLLLLVGLQLLTGFNVIDVITALFQRA